MVAPSDARQVHETWMTYDKFRIGMAVTQAVQGVANFPAIAQMDYVPFLNARQVGEVGSAYTNIASKDKTSFPFQLESIGMRFTYPDPYLNDLSPSAQAMSKVWKEIIPDHSWFEFSIREDTRLIAKPTMLPPGYGLVGAISDQQWLNNSFASSLEMGVASLGNRFKFMGDFLSIPEGTAIAGRLYFSPYAKYLLNRMSVWDLDLKDGADQTGGMPEATTYNEAAIEVTLRGTRFVQQRGEIYAP